MLFTDLHLNGNPIGDKRLLKLIEQCRTKQVTDYVKQHGTDPPKDNDKSSKSRSTNKKQTTKNAPPKSIHKLIVMRHIEDSARVVYMENVKDVRPFILTCSVRNVNLEGTNFKKFLQIQTKLHETVCDKREKSTIATHDLDKVKGGVVVYTARDPQAIEIIPLGKMKKVSAQKYYDNLKAGKQRKQFFFISLMKVSPQWQLFEFKKFFRTPKLCC